MRRAQHLQDAQRSPPAATSTCLGKRQSRGSVAPGSQQVSSISSTSHVPPASSAGSLSVYCRRLRRAFLVDSGADVSVFPASPSQRSAASSSSSKCLLAANGSSIRTYGPRSIFLSFPGLKVTHDFLLADVRTPILGSDFFRTNDLIIDIPGQRLLRSGQLARPTAVVKARPASFDGGLCGLRCPPTSTSPQTADADVLAAFPGVVKSEAFDSSKPAKHGITHTVPTSGPPVFARARRLFGEKLDVAKQEFTKMEQLGIVRRSDSPWASPLHVVPKADGSWRPCGDYRRLNAITEDDRYPLPHLQDFNARLSGMEIFSVIDLVKGFHQIPMSESDIPKTAIITPFGLFEFLRMPFGLKNAAQAFQRLMDGMLRNIAFAFVYLDDILVASPDPTTHKKHLRELFQLLQDNGVNINRKKVCFWTIRS